MVATRGQAAAQALPPRRRCPPALKDLLEQPKKAPSAKKALTKAPIQAKPPLKGIPKNPPPPIESSPSPKPEPSSPAIAPKTLTPPFIMLYSIAVTVDKTHLLGTVY
jgi:hypothetical protein